MDTIIPRGLNIESDWPLSHRLSDHVPLSVFQADIIGRSIHPYGVLGVSGDMSADTRLLFLFLSVKSGLMVTRFSSRLADRIL